MCFFHRTVRWFRKFSKRLRKAQGRQTERTDMFGQERRVVGSVLLLANQQGDNGTCHAVEETLADNAEGDQALCRREARVTAGLTADARRALDQAGLSRRRFFQTASGMAAAFVAMNEVYGGLFDVTPAEAATPDQAQARADGLKDQFIMDMHTHFLRDDTRLTGFVAMRSSVAGSGSACDSPAVFTAKPRRRRRMVAAYWRLTRACR